MKRKSKWSYIVVLSYFLVITGIGHSKNISGSMTYDKLSKKIVTSHIKWADPYYKGKINALVIAPTWGQRETVELAQRLSLKYTPMMLHTYDELGAKRACQGNLVNYSIYNIFEKKLKKKYDLIIIGKIKWSIIPATLRIAILKKVHDGTGLIYINPPKIDKELAKLFGQDKITNHRDTIINSLPLKTLPALKDIPIEEIVKLNKFGKGRVAWINYKEKVTRYEDYYRHCLTPRGGYGDNGQLYYDYYMSMLAKVSLWVADKYPDIIVNNIMVDSGKVEFVCSSSITGNFDLEFVVRDKYGKVEYSEKRSSPFKQGDNNITMKLPAVKEGSHFVDIWIKQNALIVNWASKYVKTDAINKIISLNLNKKYYKKGETVSGKVVLSTSLSEEKLKLELIDNFNRILLLKELEGTSKEFAFSFKIDQPLSILFNLKASLKNKKILSEKTVEFPVQLDNNNDFIFGVWGAENDEYLSQIIMDAYSKYGIDTIVDLSAHPKRLTDNDRRIIARNTAKANLKIIPTIWSFFNDDFYTETENGLARKPGLSDPDLIRKMTAYLKRATSIYSIYGPVAYNLGDENAVSAKIEVGYGQSTLKEFRKELKHMYGSLTQLNKIWNSSFNSWKEVKPLKWTQAKKQQNFVSWLDHRLFMEKAFADIHLKARDVIRSIDKNARVGFEGPLQRRTSTGYNFYRLFKELNFMCLYPTPIDRVGLLNSFKEKNSLTGSWFGAYDGGTFNDFTRSFPWYCLFSGMNSCYWFGGIPVKGVGEHAAFTPGFSPLEYFLTTSKEIKEIKSGLGKLLLNSHRKIGPVAIYYSPLAKYAAVVTGDKPPASYGASIDSFAYLLKDLRIEPEFISNTEINQGKLTLEYCQVLILPNTRVMSEKEATAISKFVRNGGTVIADLPPGTMNYHCVLRKESLLKPLFGDFSTTPGYNTIEKGKAIYLGTFFKTYISEKIAGLGEEKRRIFRTILKKSGISPEIKIKDHTGASLKAVTSAIFKSKSATYVGLLYFPGPSRNSAKRIKGLKKEQITIKFPTISHVYDIRDKKYLGLTDTIETEIRPSYAKVFGLLPKKINSILLKLSGSQFKGGDKIEYQFSLSPSIPGSANLKIINPAGKEMTYYSKNILFEKEYKGIIPLALNEASGEYTLRIEDVVTGKSVISKFKVTQLKSLGGIK